MQLQQENQTAKLNLLRKCGLLALNLANIFEKLLDQKTFICLRLGIGNFISSNTTRIRFGKIVSLSALNYPIKTSLRMPKMSK